MDKNTNLDPKLKEAYDRIMGTNFTPTAKPQAPQGPIMQSQPLVQQQPEQLQPQAEPTPPQYSPTSEPPMSVFTQAEPSPSKKKANLLPILFVIGGILFIGIYAVVWAKIFGLF